MSKIMYVTAEPDKLGTAYGCYPIEDYSSFNVYLANFEFVMDVARKLLGETLTVIDATYTDKVQNKAIKDIIKKNWVAKYDFIAERMVDQEAMQEIVSDVDDSLVETVDAEDI